MLVGQIVTVSDGAGWSVTVSNGGWRNYQGTETNILVVCACSEMFLALYGYQASITLTLIYHQS